MISPNEFKNGIVIKMERDLYTIISFQHIKPGKGGAFIRTKLKNVRLGTVIDKTFREVDTVEDVFVEQKKLQYLYRSGDEFHFMDNENYEQLTVDKSHLEESIGYLKEGEGIIAYMHNGSVISISVPIFVNLKVAHTEPGIRGNTAKGGFKTAEMETGMTLQVPLFINTGEVLKVDTRTGKYVGRA